jgi:ABC-type spermidine/putrescine transport system permease subunit I
MDIQNKHMHTTKTNIENLDIHIFIQYITNIKVENYKICFNDSVFIPDMSTSLQTTIIIITTTIKLSYLFIYVLSSTANGQLQSARIQTAAITQHGTKQAKKNE